ncbi:MAG: MraY family glycosyltransferase [Actinomycetota bacterium]
MREYLLTLLVTAGVTYLLTPLVRRGAIAVGAMHAGRERDVHVEPVPLLGGLAMYAGLAAGLLVASRITPLRSVFATDGRMATGLLAAGGLIVAVGFVDDKWGLNPVSKLAGQVAAGGVLVWSGAQVNWLPEPGGGTLALTPDQATALTILVVVVTINAVNFIDGLDGLAAGIVGIAAMSFFVYYYTLTRVEHLPEQAGPTLASAVLAGACIGFVPHNFYPARIFMGDTGSMLLGLLLAYAPISSIASLDYASLTQYRIATVNRFPEILPLIPPAAILIIPYADLVLAVVRRTKAGRSPFAPDRMHLHHRLLDFGHSHRSSVLIMYLWTTLFSGTVVWLSIAKTPLYILAVVTVVSVLALLLMSMPRFRWWARDRPPGRRPGGRGAHHAAPPAPAASSRAR